MTDVHDVGEVDIWFTRWKMYIDEPCTLFPFSLLVRGRHVLVVLIRPMLRSPIAFLHR